MCRTLTTMESLRTGLSSRTITDDGDAITPLCSSPFIESSALKTEIVKMFVFVARRFALCVCACVFVCLHLCSSVCSMPAASVSWNRMHNYLTTLNPCCSNK